MCLRIKFGNHQWPYTSETDHILYATDCTIEEVKIRLPKLLLCIIFTGCVNIENLLWRKIMLIDKNNV